MPQSSNKVSSPAKPAYFTPEERVRLMFLLKDSFGLPQLGLSGHVISGGEWYVLYENLQRALGRKDIGYGFDVVPAMEYFVNSAPEDELLTMLELIPFSYAVAFRKENPYYGEPSQGKIEQLRSRINSFLARIGSPARFGQDGMFTRDGFVDEAPPALKALPGKEQLSADIKSRGGGEAIAVIFLDLDNFKTVNDQQGHAAGDKCLESAVLAIGASIARKGKLYRYGGDEFVVVLPNFISTEARAAAERIRTAIERANPGGGVKVTASIGVAASDIESIAPSELIESADAAMYASKNSRKNCVTLWARGLAPAAREAK